MLNFSRAQMSPLAHRSDVRFRHDVVMLLQEDFPELANDAASLDAFVTVAMEDARALGIRGAQAMATYAVVAFLVGLDVKRDPRLIKAMVIPRLSEEDKAMWMQDWIDAITRALEA